MLEWISYFAISLGTPELSNISKCGVLGAVTHVLLGIRTLRGSRAWDLKNTKEKLNLLKSIQQNTQFLASLKFDFYTLTLFPLPADHRLNYSPNLRGAQNTCPALCLLHQEARNIWPSLRAEMPLDCGDTIFTFHLADCEALQFARFRLERLFLAGSTELVTRCLYIYRLADKSRAVSGNSVFIGRNCVWITAE